MAEWVGVAMDDGTGEGPIVAAAKAAGQEPEAKEEGEGAARVPDVGPVVPTSSEELGGLDPVQALVEENIALRVELERLRGL